MLLIGLARYAFLAAGWALPWLRAPLPRRDWRKTVTASQGVALVIAASDVPPLAVSRVLLAVALVMLVESFGRDVWWLWRHRDEAPARLAAPRARHPASTALLTLLAASRRVGRSRVPDPAVAVHPELLRAAPARGLGPGRAGRRPAGSRAGHRVVVGRASARRGRLDQGLRPRLLRSLRPGLQPGRGLELPVGRRRDGARHLRQPGRRSRGRGCHGDRSRGTRRPGVGRGPADSGRGPEPPRLAAAGGRARRRLGDLLGVRRTGLRRRGRVDERRATSRSAR